MSGLKKFLVIQALIGIAINLSINAGIGVFLVWGADSLSLWGNPGIALDTLAVAFLLPWLTVLFVAFFAHLEMKKGTVKKYREELQSIGSSYLKHMPRGVFSQSMVIGIGTALVVTPIMVGIMYAMGISEMGDRTFVVYKSAFATILTIPINPLAWLSSMVKYI